MRDTAQWAVEMIQNLLNELQKIRKYQNVMHKFINQIHTLKSVSLFEQVPT